MLHTPSDFPNIAFTREQAQALERLANQAEREPACGEMVARDLSALLSGGHALTATPARLAELWPDHPACYPALVLLQAVPQLRERYRAHGIPASILWDTLNDLPLWMSHYERSQGELGLAEYGWLSWHLQFALFRLGRLEYIYTASRVPAYGFRDSRGALSVLAAAGLRFGRGGALVEADEPGRMSAYTENEQSAVGLPLDEAGRAGGEPVCLCKSRWTRVLAPGDPVLDVHIPEGPRLTPNAVSASLAAAPAFFRERLGRTDMRAFTCASWLLSTALPEMLPGSGVAAFQRRFRVAPYTTSDRQIFERVFGRDKGDPLPQETALQRAIVQRYLAGGECRNMAGFILL